MGIEGHEKSDRNNEVNLQGQARLLWGYVFGLLLGVILATSTPSSAADEEYLEIGSWNGKKIYLSPATHSDSGSRGECGGWDENQNGYFASYYAANTQYYADVYNPTFSENNLRERHYRVRIGRDSNSVKISNSNTWGATLHIPVHSNARGGVQNDPTKAQCDSRGPIGTHVLWWSDAGHSLSIHMAEWIGRAGPTTYGPLESPGTNDRDDCDNKVPLCTSISPLGELTQTNAVASYIELEFHDNTVGADWLRKSQQWAWRFSVGIDRYLGYPR